MPQFVKDVEEIRNRARRQIDEGAVTEAYRGDKDRAITILNEALATEIVCVLRYMHHYFMATGVHGKSVADEFKEHADAERDHADQIADRIQQLGGKPDYNPKSLLERSASQYIEGETLADMIREDLVAERIVIEVYTDMIRHFGDNDPTTRVMLEGILKDEEEHASDLADLLFIVDPQSGRTEGQDPGTHPLDMHAGGQQGDGRGQQRRGGQERQQRGNQQQGRAEQQRNQQQQQRGNQQQQRGEQQQGRGEQQRQQPKVTQREAGKTFAGTETPNPPQPIRQQGRGQRGQQQGGQRQRGNGGNQPLQPSYFQGERGQEQQGRQEQQQGRQEPKGERGGRKNRRIA
jgi:bacterioferritin